MATESTNPMPEWAVIAEIAPLTPIPGIDMRVISGDKIMLSFVTIAAGAHVPMHHHPHEQAGTVIEGMVVMTIGNETRELRPGDAYVIPGHVPHGTTATDAPCVVLDAFSPPREDYLRR